MDGVENPAEEFSSIVRGLVKHNHSDDDVRKVVGENIVHTRVERGMVGGRRRTGADMKDEDFDELFRQLSSGQFSGGSSTWEDVRAEFDELTRTIGKILQTAWQTSDTESALGRVRDLVATALEDWNHTLDGTPEAQQAREQLERLTESLASAAAQAGDQVRPELLRLLRYANGELRKRSSMDQNAR